MLSLTELGNNQKTFYVDITTAQAEGITVGRKEYPVVDLFANTGRWTPSPEVLDFFNLLNGNSKTTKNARRIISSNLHNNRSEYPFPREQPFKHERPVSAYYTYNPQGQTLIIEWGTIDLKTKEAKLHNYLYQVIDYPDRVKQGMQLSSGHLARTESGIWLALLDKVSHEPNYRLPILKEGPVGQMINTLWAHGFVPLTTEGYVQLPVFR